MRRRPRWPRARLRLSPTFASRPSSMRASARVAVALVVGFLVPVAAQKGDEPPKWDVATASLGPTRPIAFETTEGTWVNVDVSPDGRTVVFDLLGDLYAMPIDGTGSGLAVRLTSGGAFDM